MVTDKLAEETTRILHDVTTGNSWSPESRAESATRRGAEFHHWRRFLWRCRNNPGEFQIPKHLILDDLGETKSLVTGIEHLFKSESAGQTIQTFQISENVAT